MTGVGYRARRLALGLSQREIAEWFGVAQTTWSRWENGTSRPATSEEVDQVAAWLQAAEDARDEITTRLYANAETQDQVTFITYRTTTALWDADPHCRQACIPAPTHAVAVAHAATRCRNNGKKVNIIDKR